MDTAPLISNLLRSKIRKNPKILLVTPKNLPDLYSSITIFYNQSNIQIVADEKNLIFEAIESCNALIGCPRNIFNDDLLEKGKDLLWIHNPGAGIEHFLSEKFINSDIIFTNGKKIQGPECADHAMALLLSLTRNIKLSIKGLENNLMPRPVELLGKKALVVGLGGIGMC